jgi:hypothetical protein
MSTGSCRSALFVDFDNIYIGLKQQDQELARRFATKPARWIEWLQRSLRIPAGSWLSPDRRILVRRCYLNPQSFSSLRPFFIRDAFETIDCPPLTAHGKTSADVHMVLDIVDLLSSDVFDEFIIMSADADFTPVLLKLRKHDRRSIVLAIGPSSSAYTAASDLVIDQESFCDFLMSSDTPARSIPVATANTLPASTEPQIDPVSRTVREIVGRSQHPVALASLADAIRTRHPDVAREWGGLGSFSALLGELSLSNIVRVNTGPGYLYDPERHTPPTADPPRSETLKIEVPKVDPLATEDPSLRDVAYRVADLTETPYLSSATYATLFSMLSDEITANGYEMTRVSRAVRDDCTSRGLSIGRQPINFILRGIQFSGHRFAAGNDTPAKLAEAFCRNTYNLCARNQLFLTTLEESLVAKWLVGHDLATTRDEALDADGALHEESPSQPSSEAVSDSFHENIVFPQPDGGRADEDFSGS